MTRTVIKLRQTVQRLQQEKKAYLQKIRHLQTDLAECRCKKPLHTTLLKTDKDVQFHTGIETKEAFNILHDYIAPLVQRRWKGVKRVVNKVRPQRKGKKRGPGRKLTSKDEFLRTTQKLRLRLLLCDLVG